ncbi:hypothetical protein ACFQ3Z_04915 [Streptomyces nogalater]
MHEFLTTLHSSGARILTGTASAAECARPMSLVGQLLGTVEAENASSHPGPSAAHRAAEALLHLVSGERPSSSPSTTPTPWTRIP